LYDVKLFSEHVTRLVNGCPLLIARFGISLTISCDFAKILFYIAQRELASLEETIIIELIMQVIMAMSVVKLK
jgi:hypothetical protein